MRAVGIKMLKAKLGEYVRLAKSGETILVTEREEVVAELRPARRQRLGAPDAVEEALEAMADRGEACLRSAEGAWPAFEPCERPAGFSSAALLDALRGESGEKRAQSK